MASHASVTVTQFNATVRDFQQVFIYKQAVLTNLAASPAASLTGVGDYDGVNYNAFSILGNQLIGGVASQSPPNRIVTNSQQQATNGTPTLTPDTPYVYLGLEDFYFGCALHTDESVASTAVQCTITVAGFAKGSDQEVALASFTFTPPSLAVAPVPMEHAVLPVTFLKQKVVNVTIIQNDPLTKALLVDNVRGFLSTS